MSKNILYYCALLLGLGCANPPTAKFSLSGTVKNAEQLEGVFLENALVLGKVKFGTGGSFKLELPEQPKMGIYFLQIGQKRMLFVLDGTEKNIQIETDLSALVATQYKVKGSTDTEQFLQMMERVIAGTTNVTEVKTFVENTKNPLLGMVVAHQLKEFMSPDYVDFHKKNYDRVESVLPNSVYAKEYLEIINELQRVEIKTGIVAPDIQLPNPSGKAYSLSSLKGKVVLLDFWASWCGPCRRANPEVVALYNRYKDKGFTVFSVSLDKNKENWQTAIQQDGLSWEYHVSDLRFWDSAPAKTYGVRGIPQQYLIDKEGKIAAIIAPGQSAEPFFKKNVLNMPSFIVESFGNE